MLHSSDIRKLMASFTTTGLTQCQYRHLQALVKNDSPFLSAVVDSSDKTGDKHLCKDIYKELINQLSRNYPVCSIFPKSANLWEILQKITNDENISPGETLCINEQVPLLGEILRKNAHLPAEMLPILEKIKLVLNSTFSKSSPHNLLPTTNDNKFAYFPVMPQLCERGIYRKDNKTTRKRKIDSCVKTSNEHSTLSPGLLHMSCVHGKQFFYSHNCKINTY